MEIGDCLTNVLSINDLSSIQYYYLEISSIKTQLGRVTIHDIEAEWRKAGALVFADKSCLWLFANNGDAGPSIPSGATFDLAGNVHFNGNILAILQKGLFEPANAWKSLRQAATSSISQNNALSPGSPTDNSSRSAQILNAKTQGHNVDAGMSKESGVFSSSGKNEVASIEPTLPDRIIRERFISSVLATLSYRMCCESGFISLNARTLVLSSPNYRQGDERNTQSIKDMLLHEPVLLVTLDVHLTSTGTLVLKAYPSQPVEFSCVTSCEPNPPQPSNVVEGTTILLAPSGRVGKYEGPVLDEFSGGLLEYGNIGASIAYSMASWKTRCTHWLGKKGIGANLLENSNWIYVQISSQANLIDSFDTDDGGLWTPHEKFVTIAWPAVLCFQRTTSEMSDAPTSSLFLGYDPLSFAEEWFIDTANREAMIEKRRKDREAAAAAVKLHAGEGETRILPLISNSPVALRRASIAGAVYPTPPDGIQPVVGATPSFDGTVSTPGQPNPQSLPMENENVAMTKAEPGETGGNMWEENDTKREEPNVNIDFSDSVNDNLFGDIGGDLFGENDITDADFSFFDEPDNNAETRTSEINSGNGSDDNRDPYIIANSNNPGIAAGATEMQNLGVQCDVVMADDSPEQKYGLKEANLSDDGGRMAAGIHEEETQFSPSPQKKTLTNQPSPPLSPENIFKRLSIAEVGLGVNRSSFGESRTVSAFGGFDFESSLSSFNKKYGATGHFIYPPIPKRSASNQRIILPETGYLDNKRRKKKPIVVNVINATPEPSKEHFAPERNEHSSQSDDESPNYSRVATPMSDRDDTSNSTENLPIIFTPSLKRKRGSEDEDDGREVDADIISPSEDIVTDCIDLVRNLESMELLDPNILDADPADWSLAKFLMTPEPFAFSSSISDAEYIASAQVLAEQAISETLHIPKLSMKDASGALVDICADCQNSGNLIQQNLSLAVKSCFEQFAECTLNSVLDIQDAQVMGQTNRVQPRPISNSRSFHISESAKPSAIFTLAPPHLEVRRAESKLVVLPSAIPFWENLGLGPCKGGKDVSAICVYPDSEGMKDNVDGFLDHTQSAYESNRLGSHERFSHADLANGHLPMDFGTSSVLSVADHQAILVKIKETAIRLADLLISGSNTETNIVIYQVYNSHTPELIVPLCSAFQDLFGMYKDGLAKKKLPIRNELVLQLVPLSFIASPTSLVVPPPCEYARLALEVFDRCVDLSLGTSIPSMILEQPLPRNIDFKCTATPSASPLQENSVMHVAYAQSIDDRWITAAWTDNTGTRQMTASYCLGRRNTSLTTAFTDVANEIWETTLEIIAYCKVQWRIIIVKCGIMEHSEIEFWKGLVVTERDKEQITLTLITADTNPSLMLIPPAVSLLPNILATQSSVYSSPVSTPQPSIVSPEQSGNASTPARDSQNVNTPTPGESSAEPRIDLDARLVDVTDQTWGVILSHRLNNTNSLLQFAPTLASGYLVKRSGAGQTDIPVIIEVNIILHEVPGKVIHHEVPVKTYEPLLREILGFYRGLATLARVRGVVNAAKDGRPWHIAAAEKAVTALYMLM